MLRESGFEGISAVARGPRMAEAPLRCSVDLQKLRLPFVSPKCLLLALMLSECTMDVVLKPKVLHRCGLSWILIPKVLPASKLPSL